MFNKESKKHDLKAAETVIGPSIRVKGNFHGQGDIVIEGQVDGNVSTNSFLYVGQKARITASVEAKEASVSGEIRGNLKIKGYLEITSTAKVLGDIEASEMSMEKGAVLNGRCTMSRNHEPEKHENRAEEKK